MSLDRRWFVLWKDLLLSLSGKTVHTGWLDPWRAKLVCMLWQSTNLPLLPGGEKKSLSQVILAVLGVTLKNVKQRESGRLHVEAEGIEDFYHPCQFPTANTGVSWCGNNSLCLLSLVALTAER